MVLGFVFNDMFAVKRWANAIRQKKEAEEKFWEFMLHSKGSATLWQWVKNEMRGDNRGKKWVWELKDAKIHRTVSINRAWHLFVCKCRSAKVHAEHGRIQTIKPDLRCTMYWEIRGWHLQHIERNVELECLRCFFREWREVHLTYFRIIGAGLIGKGLTADLVDEIVKKM